MLIIYGSMLCKDCVQCVEDLKRANISFEFCDFADNIVYLSEFMHLRDQEPIFDRVKKEGNIGIPCIVGEDGSISLSWDWYVCQAMPDIP